MLSLNQLQLIELSAFPSRSHLLTQFHSIQLLNLSKFMRFSWANFFLVYLICVKNMTFRNSVGPRGPTLRGPICRGPICLEPRNTVEKKMPRAEVANWASTSGKSGRRLTDHGRRPKHAVWQRKQIWNMDRKEIQLKKCQEQKWQIGRQEVANWAKGEKQLYSRNQWTCVSFFDENW